MKRMAFIIITAILVIAVAIYTYLGGFSNLNIRTENIGGEAVVYKEITGNYNNLTPVTDEIYYYLLNELNIETYKGFGIFYDNPQQVEKDKLRADAGCIIEAKDIDCLKSIDSKYKFKTLPIEKSVVAELPYRGNISILFGFIKVFPAIDKYRKEHNLNDGPLMSIADVPNKKIIYRKVVKEAGDKYTGEVRSNPIQIK